MLIDNRLNPAYYPPTKRGRRRKRGRPRKYKDLIEQVFPGSERGRPRVNAFWKLDLFSRSGCIDAIIGQGTKQTASKEAAGFVGKLFRGQIVNRAVLHGPYRDMEAMEHDVEDDDEPTEIVQVVEKKKRGKPKKSKSAVITPVSKKQLRKLWEKEKEDKYADSGQFVGAYAGLNDISKRKRGRPRKIPLIMRDDRNLIEELVLGKKRKIERLPAPGYDGPKRKRGRPPKIQPIIVTDKQLAISMIDKIMESKQKSDYPIVDKALLNKYFIGLDKPKKKKAKKKGKNPSRVIYHDFRDKKKSRKRLSALQRMIAGWDEMMR